MEALISSSLTIDYSDTGSGRPLVLLHAFPCTRELWAGQIAEFSGSLRVIAPNLRGFDGTSPFGDDVPSIETMAGDVAALLDNLKIEEPIILGGLSMGGYTALAFARLFPERLAGLILADTKAEPDDDAGKAVRAQMIALARTNGGLAVAENFLPKLVGPATLAANGEPVALVRLWGGRQPVGTITGALAALRDRPDSLPYLAAIEVPTLVIGGELDPITPPLVMAGLAAAIPNARHVVIPGAGHLANLEQPEAFDGAVWEFLQQFVSAA